MARVQRFFIIGIIIAIVVLAIYGYFTDQLPIVRRPGGAATGATPGAGQVEAPRVAPGQQFTFGSGTYTVNVVDRSADITRARRTTRGAFVTIHLSVMNGGREPLTFTPASFQLFDRNARRYTVNPDVTRALADEQRIDLSQATIQPGLSANGVLVFDVAGDASGLVLRITQGYQDVALNQ